MVQGTRRAKWKRALETEGRLGNNRASGQLSRPGRQAVHRSRCGRRWMVRRNRRGRSRSERFHRSAWLRERDERSPEVHEQGRNALHLRTAMTAAAAFRWVIVAALSMTSVAAAGARPNELRVCADPNNLPFSNTKGE